MIKLLDIFKIKDSTHTIYGATKTGWSNCTIYRLDEKNSKSTGKLESNFPCMTKLKALIKALPQFPSMSEKIF